MQKGITFTAPGFYGPQGRVLRTRSQLTSALLQQAQHFIYQDLRITNFEMETSAIYGLARLLGHRAVSCNAIIANRATGDFSKSPGETVDQLILEVLERVKDLDA